MGPFTDKFHSPLIQQRMAINKSTTFEPEKGPFTDKFHSHWSSKEWPLINLQPFEPEMGLLINSTTHWSSKEWLLTNIYNPLIKLDYRVATLINLKSDKPPDPA